MIEFLRMICVKWWLQSIFQPKFKCSCCEMLVFRVCGVRQNLYVFCLYRNPDLDDRIFDCLITSMAAVQAEDVHDSFLFVGDLNDHHRSGLLPRPPKSLCCSLWLHNCEVIVLRSVGGRTNPCMGWNTWPHYDWCSWPSKVVVVAPIANSDHSSLSAVISMVHLVWTSLERVTIRNGRVDWQR